MGVIKVRKVLFISSFITMRHTGGGIASSRNLDLCKSLFNADKVDVIAFSYLHKNNYDGENIKILPGYKNKLVTFYNNLCFFSGGLSLNNVNDIKLLSRDYDYFFLDSSLLGRISKIIKLEKSKSFICVFFHNVEFEFNKIRMKTTRQIWLLPLLLSSYFNEKIACKFSDIIISYNKRDSEKIRQLYGRGADLIVPITLEDKFDSSKVVNNASSEIIYLFLGSYFFANVDGILWFVNKVLPNVPGKLQIIGTGMEKLRNLIDNPRVDIIGFVDDVSSYYYNADFVVMPIFKGSGIKIKTAEALMFGKVILGTREAFEGYEIDNYDIGKQCDSAEEFVSAINYYISLNLVKKFNPASRELFLNKYCACNTKRIISNYFNSSTKNGIYNKMQKLMLQEHKKNNV